ncbi:MAG: aminotransferase class III-fold pyridoxal phosphate-dependent enzyme, partial [Halobacteria archaeon]|nr:aminotransferase class III-fold pyridoxal phosphate-dependent enzyme [Halobacteria archaeon]
MNTDRSRSLYDRALSSLVGGVNSSVRAEPQPYPFFVRKGDGSHIVDVDGNKYVDYAMGYGPLLLGHELPEEVRAAVQQKVDEGPMYGAPTKIEVELAEFVADHVPSVESVRFVNSGTEATMSAVRLARGYTGRDKIVMMRGGYHGGHESFLAEGEAGSAEPSCPGVPDSFAEHVLPVDFNDAEEAERVFEEHGDEIAGVITEPLLGDQGIVLPVDG